MAWKDVLMSTPVNTLEDPPRPKDNDPGSPTDTQEVVKTEDTGFLSDTPPRPLNLDATR